MVKSGTDRAIMPVNHGLRAGPSDAEADKVEYVAA